ncbi:MAG TPA: hypothetical protein VM939_00725 [Gemmatimonadaceae bacterium]|nr:hypothetical protein [Gemmatimonadaceae bacterium]
MKRGSLFWPVVAGLFTLINVGGLVYAAAMSEPMHALVHVGLLLGGIAACLVWRPALWARRDDEPTAQLGEARLDYLQQSVDAIALEVERIGEAQRFHEKLRARSGISEGGKPSREPSR